MAQPERKAPHEVILSRMGMHLLSQDAQRGSMLIMMELFEILDEMDIPKDAAANIAERIAKLQKAADPSLHNRINKSLTYLRSMTGH